MSKTMKVAARFGVTIVAAVGLSLGGVATANATNLYDHNNYGVFLWGGSSSPGGLPISYNDRTSSFTNVGIEVYCENANCSGRKLTWSGNANSLGAITTGLGFGETWSDRISSVQ